MRWSLRIFVRPLALVGLGVATSVLVAWAAAWTSDWKPLPRGRFDAQTAGNGTEELFVSWDHRGWGTAKYCVTPPLREGETVTEYFSGFPGISLGPTERWSIPSWVRLDVSDRLTSMFSLLWQAGCGWPRLCLGMRCGNLPDSSRLVNIEYAGALGINPQVFDLNKPFRSKLPLLPLWSGLAVDTAVFSSAWWVLTTGPRVGRRWRRRRGERCGECGYPVAGLEKCPECGRVCAGGGPLPGGPDVRRVLRILRCAAVFVLVGAVINVGVAVVCAVWSPLMAVDQRAEFRASPENARLIPDGWLVPARWPSMYALHECLERGLGVEEQDFGTQVTIPGSDTSGPDRVLHVQRAGWPVLALECDGVSLPCGPGTHTQTPTAEWHGALVIAEVQRPCLFAWMFGDPCLFAAHPIPMRPIWPGFAVNTLVYGAACWMVFAVPRGARRMVRRRRGRCVGCGYPVKGLERCPECGAGTLV